jgi:hypothetical protein
MAIRFFCKCGQKLKAPEKKIGTTYDCPICGAPVVVPKESDPLAKRAKAGLTEELATGPQENSADRRGSAEQRELVGVAAELRRESQRAGAPHTSAAAAAEQGASASAGASAASIARDLITRRIAKGHEEKPASVAAVPRAAEEEGIDYAALAQELGRTLLPGIAVIVVLCMAVYWLSSSVMSTRALPDLGKVSGVVTLDGVPLRGAIITFQPVASEEPGSKLSSSVGRTDEEGLFTLTYVKDVPGAVVGEHKVFVQAPAATGKETLPARYNTKTELTEEVQPGSNEFEFKLEASR